MLAIGEIEVDVLVLFPRQHQTIVMNVSAAEADESPRKPHLLTPEKSFGNFSIGQVRRISSSNYLTCGPQPLASSGGPYRIRLL